MVSEPKYNLFGYQDSPYIMEIDLHQNSHRETMMELDTLKESYFEKAADKDGISGNLESIKAEMRKGRDYVDRMGTKLENLIGEYLELGPQSMDYNDNFLGWIEKYDSEFNALSETAKTTATYRYLQGFTNLDTKKESNISGTHLPAVSETPRQPTLLDAQMLKDYFKKYNNQIKDNQNLGSLKNIRYRSFMSIAKGLCE